MPELDRLSEPTGWSDSDFVERERPPEFAIHVGIRFHLAGVSLSNAGQRLATSGAERSPTTIHDRVREADPRPDGDVEPAQTAVGETAIRVDGPRHWLSAAVDSDTDQLPHVRRFRTRATQLALLFLRASREKRQLNDARFPVDGAARPEAALGRLGLRFRVCRHGHRTAIERGSRE